MKILALVGPTAAGKSSLVEELISRNDRFLFISCDSRKIYRGMDIGTNKPPPWLRRKFRLIDIIDPSLSYSAQDFARDALRESKMAWELGKVPIVVAGTPLYYRALFFGLFDATPPDPEIRALVLRRLREEGGSRLYAELMQVDPETAMKVHPRDWIRVTRALEVFYQFGKPISRLRIERRPSNTPRPLAFGVMRERKELYLRINKRVDRMISQGLVDEVRTLLERGYDLSSPGLRTIGYVEIVRHLCDGLPLKEAVRLIKKRTRIYARKQMYFFRNLGPIKWYLLPHLSPLEDILRAGDRM